MIPRFPVILLLSALLAVSTWSCAPATVRAHRWGTPGTPDDVAMVKNLPKDQALGFLRSLYVPEAANTCRFEQDGVLRWWKGELLPGKTRYNLLYDWGLMAQGGRGPLVRIVLSVRGTNELWCLIHPQLFADGQGKDATPFIKGIFTMLKVMGVTALPLSEASKVFHSPSWSEVRWIEVRAAVAAEPHQP